MATSRMTPVMTELPSIFYEEPEKLEDGMLQAFIITEVAPLIASYFRGDRNTLVSTGGFIFYDRTDGNRRVVPDLYVSFDVDVQGLMDGYMPNYLIWQHGKPPDFVMEVASPSTADNDLGYKGLLYARLGIQEYWRLDPTGGELYGRPLVGERLVDGEYRPYELHTAADGTTWSHSEVLNLRIHWQPDMDVRNRFDVRDPDTGLTVKPEVIEREGRLAEREGRLAAEARASEEREGRMAAEARASEEREGRLAEREKRLAADARERELLAEIERLRHGRSAD